MDENKIIINCLWFKLLCLKKNYFINFLFIYPSMIYLIYDLYLIFLHSEYYLTNF